MKEHIHPGYVEDSGPMAGAQYTENINLPSDGATFDMLVYNSLIWMPLTFL